MSDFLEYLTGLAPEGETALILRQKPTLRDGEIQYHSDGAPKATFPAFLPSHKRRDGESWFINTGSFIIDRFDGKPSAKRENVEFVLFMMLDDVGTKSKVSPLPPTWIMETSEGSFQWGYAFKEQPTKGAFSSAIKAIAAAGYTDPGAINPVRNCRLPGSVNLKLGRNNFPARLVEFHPEREYTPAADLRGDRRRAGRGRRAGASVHQDPRHGLRQRAQVALREGAGALPGQPRGLVRRRLPQQP